jgi:hypothetical protein
MQPIPDPNSLIVYGFTVMSVVAAVIYVVEWLLGVPLEDKAKTLIQAVGAIAGYLIVANLAFLETLVPSLPTWLPQVLGLIMLFAATLGFTPGAKFQATVNKVKSLGK